MKELQQELKRKTQFMLWVQPGGTKVLKTTHSIRSDDPSNQRVPTALLFNKQLAKNPMKMMHALFSCG